MPRTWKAALAPFLAGIPERTGFVGEARFGLLNDLRWGEQRAAAHDRPLRRAGAARKATPPPPTGRCRNIEVPQQEVAAWRERHGLAADEPAGRRVRARRGRARRSAGRPSAMRELARQLTAAGISVWVLGGPGEKPLAARDRRPRRRRRCAT